MNIANYFRASYNELVNKVSWPTWQELINSAILVLIASLIFALLILLMDSASDGLTKLIYKSISH